MVVLKKIRAASLVEVTVSLVILMMVFSLSLMIYINVTKSTISPKLQLKMALNDYSLLTKRERNYTNDEKVFGVFLIRREVQLYHNNPDLILCSFSAFDEEEKLIVTQKELIYVQD